MKIFIKIIVIVFSLFFPFLIFSQESKNESYLQLEKERIEKVKLIENDVESFISKNVNKYRIDEKSSIFFGKKADCIDHCHDNLTIDEEYKFIHSLKRSKLREIFFQQNPDKLSFYNVTSLDGEYRLICDNGGFEGVVPLAGYRFFSNPIASNLQCAVPIPQTNFIPLINDFGALATLIDNSDISWNATMQFDETLNTPAYGNLQIPTLSPNGGSRAIKLNNNNGGGDVTTMSRDILINDNLLEYEFSLMLQNSNHAGTNQQPIFKVEIFDLNGNLIQQRCVISQPDCNFTIAPFNLDPADARSILFTDWICDAVDVSALIDAPVVNGVNATVTFTIADCGRNGHFGTVYIDNICNFTCGNPAFGLVQIEPVNGCPDYINNTPFQICGDYNVPANANNVNFTINFSTDDGQTFNPINQNLFNLVINSLTNQTGNFCFQLNPNFFLTDPNANYLFQIVQTFDQNCALGTFPVVNSSLAVVNISQCCLPTLTSSIAISGMVQEERELWINSTDFITFQDNIQGNGVVYHAGNFVELNPGFEAVFGSQFTAYPEGCTNPQSFVYRNQNVKDKSDSDIDNLEINLVKVEDYNFVINPNPSSNTIEIKSSNSFTKVTIVSLEGRVVYDKENDKTNSLQVDVSGFADGVYIVNVVEENGKLVSQKLIKN